MYEPMLNAIGEVSRGVSSPKARTDKPFKFRVPADEVIIINFLF